MIFRLFIQKVFGSRLTIKLALFFVILASVPILTLGATALSLINTAHRQDISLLELQLLRQKQEEIQKFFSDTQGLIELQVAYSEKAPINLSQAQFLLDSLLKQNPSFVEASFITLNGKESIKKNNQGIETNLYDVSQLPRFTEAFNGQNYVSSVHETLQGPIVTISAPVYNSMGTIVEVLAAEVNISQIIKSINTTLLGSKGYILLTDNDGTILSAPSQGLVRSGMNINSTERIQALKNEGILSGLNPDDLYLGYSAREPVIGAGIRIPKISWMLLLEWPLSDANSIIGDIRFEVLLFTLGSIIGVLLIAPIFAHRLTKPIYDLNIAAHDIEQGNLKRRISIYTNDELEDLGHSFNQMAEGLQKLEELRREFVYVIAHELRSPITAIKGYVSMIEEGAGGVLTKEMKELIDPVAQSSKHLNELINDLLDIARSEAGKLTILTTSVDIESIIIQCSSELEAVAHKKNISLLYTKPVTSLVVLADPVRLKEIIINLISNGIKYNKEGGNVKVYHEFSSSSIITHIQDTGLGISEEDQKHLFEKFYRGDKVNMVTGTGLGLFITKELIERMGGHLFFQSTLGIGSQFSFSLPLALLADSKHDNSKADSSLKI